jgi:hypothetical protein
MRSLMVMLCGLGAALVFGVTIGSWSCTPSSAKGAPTATKSETTPIAAPAPRHLGQEYAVKYMTEKFRLLEKPDCAVWEDNGYNHLQSSLCSINDVILVYCHAGDGKPPNCEITIDKRPKPPEADKLEKSDKDKTAGKAKAK